MVVFDYFIYFFSCFLEEDLLIYFVIARSLALTYVL